MTDSIVRYGSFDDTSFDEAAQQVDDLGGGHFIKAEVGENVFRFLPPPLGRNSAVKVTSMHYIDAIPGLEKKLVFACPRVVSKQACIACAKAEELIRSGNPHDRERGKKIQGKMQVYANVLNRRSTEPVVKVYKFGKQVFEQLKAIRKSARLGGDFTNPTDAGFDIVIFRKGTGQNDTEYMVQADRQNRPLHPDPTFAQLLIDNQPDLEALVDPTIPEALLLAWGSTQQGGFPNLSQAVRHAPLPPAAMPQRWNPPSAVNQAQQQAAIPTTGHAVQDAQDVEYDDDFNPIPKRT